MPNELTDYLRRFDGRQRVTLIGPTLARAAGAEQLAEKLREPLIWVDGGVDFRDDFHRGKTAAEAAGFAVGDGDSARGQLDQYLNPDKDYSDLAFVLRRLPAHFTEVVLLGFLGARRDHELFNLGEVHHFLAAATTPTQARFDECIRAYTKGEWRLNLRGAFSLAVLAPATVALTGACKYPIATPRKIAPLSSFGLSNEGDGEIMLRADGPVFIFNAAYNTAA